jgi:hypothetical protein
MNDRYGPAVRLIIETKLLVCASAIAKVPSGSRMKSSSTATASGALANEAVKIFTRRGHSSAMPEHHTSFGRSLFLRMVDMAHAPVMDQV